MKKLIILLILILPSCNQDLEEKTNAKFLEQFDKEVARIRTERTQVFDNEQQEIKPAKKYEDWRNASDMLGVEGTEKYRSAEVDTSGLKIKTFEEYLPNHAVFDEGQKSNFRPKLPDDMFDIYFVRNYPQFKNPGIEFDLIQVPENDVYGIRTDLGDKEYLLVGNNSLQKNLDELRGYHTRENNKIAKTLVTEQKQRKRQRRINEIFGSNEAPTKAPSETLNKTPSKTSTETLVETPSKTTDKILVETPKDEKIAAK